MGRKGSVKKIGFGRKILQFFFGKEPDIFTERLEIQHRHPRKKWEEWMNRYKMDPSLDWRNHTGQISGAREKSKH
jgi:hypothetical protein